MDNQNLLISVESMLDIHPLANFNILFSYLKDHHLDLDYHRLSIPAHSWQKLKKITLKPMSKTDLIKTTFAKVIQMLNSVSCSPSLSQKKKSLTSGDTMIMWSLMHKLNSQYGISLNP